MPRTRRSLLAATASFAVGVLGGCVARDGGGTADASTENRTTSDRSPSAAQSSESATATPLPDRTVALPDGPKTRPDHPDSLTLETARTYARKFEYGYVYNSLWYSESTEVTLSCEVVDAREVDVGYKVVVSCTGYSNTGGGGESDGNTTATMVHADYFTQVYTYLLDEDSVVRRRATAAEKS
ncbi:hypothetical protein SAMN04487949_1999 [Halogranum gelatinilyticum]|uniref:Lipoprotein n=1 Tax=Halogranum gelatinilyticum TaxID=660521 RepID=A0A1G9U1L8_9EURY|nr:hypothetical protein [Halogranum gelatinilyticum]SDM53772.1 hypothetical protein SAMN04487949_1999 [Halogranum gelatinilyticum]